MILVNSSFRLQLDTGINLTGLIVSIVYRKPDSAIETTVGATITDLTKCYYDFTPAINDTVGKWLFKVKVVDGLKTYYSFPVYVNIRDEWHPWD